MLNKNSLVVVYGMGSFRQLNDFVTVTNYSDKSILAERILSLHNFSMVSQNDVTD